MERKERIPDRGEDTAEAQEDGECFMCTGDHRGLPVGHARRTEGHVARDEIKSSKTTRGLERYRQEGKLWVTGVWAEERCDSIYTVELTLAMRMDE